MSQNPLIDSGTQSSKTPALKPALVAALASLEVQLDQELARYRRTRTGTRTINQTRLGSNISSPSPPLTAITTISDKTQPSATEIKANTPPFSLPYTPQEESAPATVNTESFDNLHLDSASNTETRWTAPNSISSIVPAGIKVTQSENSYPSDDSPKPPDDYLESSEALLRSLTEEQPPTRKPSNSDDSLLSPLGVGSMLLLLVASLSLGYVLFNPKGLSQLNIGKLFNGNSSSTPNNTAKPQGNLPQKQEPELRPIPKYPNLAAKEFPDVTNQNDVVVLKPKLQAPATALPNPDTIEKPANPTTSKPVPPVPPLATLNSPLNPKTKVDQIKPPGDGLYHIVMDNQGDRAFSKARQVIPDAYLSLDNKLIYLGALKTKEEVQQYLQQLQAKGIKARVQQP